MSGSRRRFTAEYKIEAAHRVIDSGRAIAEVARDLSLNEVTLGGYDSLIWPHCDGLIWPYLVGWLRRVVTV